MIYAHHCAYLFLRWIRLICNCLNYWYGVVSKSLLFMGVLQPCCSSFLQHNPQMHFIYMQIA